MPRLTLFAACSLLASVAGRARAQEPLQRWQAEARLEALSARTTAWHAVVGANAVLGMYTRSALLVGAGARRWPDGWRRSGRVDAVVRFHVDPFLQFGREAYVSGGGSLLFDDGTRARGRTVIAFGVESTPARSGWITGAELGLGGGVRLAVTFRKARAGGR